MFLVTVVWIACRRRKLRQRSAAMDAVDGLQVPEIDVRFGEDGNEVSCM